MGVLCAQVREGEEEEEEECLTSLSLATSIRTGENVPLHVRVDRVIVLVLVLLIAADARGAGRGGSRGGRRGRRRNGARIAKLGRKLRLLLVGNLRVQSVEGELAGLAVVLEHRKDVIVNSSSQTQ